MEIDALETSDEARFWGNRILQRLEEAFQADSQPRVEFPEPDSPFWVLGVAKELCENWDNWSVPSAKTANAANLEPLLQKVAQWLRQCMSQPISDDLGALRRLVSVQIATELYLKIRHGNFQKVEGALLQVPFASGHSTAIKMGVDLLLQQPPNAWTSASLALSPLLQYPDWEVDSVFPRILESANPSVLASALDIANHLFANRTVDSHPAKSRYHQLVDLLGLIVQRLGVLEENPAKFGETPDEIQRILFDSISLCVSLCHTMANLGDDECVGKLNQALDLKHRRIRAEASFALAKLGQPNGIDALVELAADSAVRTRVLAYAEELGCSDKIDEQHRSVLALAESQLAQWLAQVEQMGLPPTRIELLEQRTLTWPGFEAPQECFLFRFGYGMLDSEFSNVGFAGPVAKAFSQDLANVPLDDTFAIFAGWDIEHPDIFETPANRLAVDDDTMITHWMSELQPEKFDQISPEFVGNFFEQLVLVGYGEKSGRKQAFAFDGREIVAIPSLLPTPDSLTLTYYLWRGREFFRTFE